MKGSRAKGEEVPFSLVITLVWWSPPSSLLFLDAFPVPEGLCHPLAIASKLSLQPSLKASSPGSPPPQASSSESQLQLQDPIQMCWHLKLNPRCSLSEKGTNGTSCGLNQWSSQIDSRCAGLSATVTPALSVLHTHNTDSLLKRIPCHLSRWKTSVAWAKPVI